MKTTTHVAMGRCVLKLVQDPERYQRKTLKEQAELFQNDIGLDVSEGSINSIFEAAGIERIGPYSKRAEKVSSSDKIESLSRAIVRQLETIKSLGIEFEIDPVILKLAEREAK